MIFNKKQEAFKRGYDQGVFDTIMDILYQDPIFNHKKLTKAQQEFMDRLHKILGEIDA